MGPVGVGPGLCPISTRSERCRTRRIPGPCSPITCSLDGVPAAVCQRSFLKRDGGSCRRTRACAPGVVRERVLARRRRSTARYVPIDSGLCFSTISVTVGAGLCRGPGGGARRAGDSARAVLRRARSWATGDLDRGTRLRRVGSGRAAFRPRDDPRHREGGMALVASLAPKPWPENAGNGGHVHFSLWEGERNRFYDGARADGLSDDARSFMAGVWPRTPSRALRAYGAELQLVPPDRPRSTGPARSSAGASTTARRRSASPRRSAAPRKRRRTPS